MTTKWSPGNTMLRLDADGREFVTFAAHQGSVGADPGQEFRIFNRMVGLYDLNQQDCRPGYHAVVFDREGRQVRTHVPTRLLQEAA